jgi:hypothetical protein
MGLSRLIHKAIEKLNAVQSDSLPNLIVCETGVIGPTYLLLSPVGISGAEREPGEK